jgi:hypothetical protein
MRVRRAGGRWGSRRGGTKGDDMEEQTTKRGKGMFRQSRKQLDNNPGYLLATLHGDLKKGDHEYVKLDDEIRE